METIWVLVADQHRLRVFEILEKDGNFHEVVDFLSPKGRLSTRSASESASEYAIGNTNLGRADGSATTNFPSQDDELFCKQISSYLENARRGSRFTKLRIIAPLDFLILLRNNMGKRARQSVEGVVVHDLANVESINAEAFLRSIKFSVMKKSQRDPQSMQQAHPGASH